MIDLRNSFPGKRQHEHQEALKSFADAHGRIPEAGDDRIDFDYERELGPWEDWVAVVSRAVNEQLASWRQETTGPAHRFGFLLTATRQCGTGRHELCPGWGRRGSFEVALESLDGSARLDTPAACACPCGHGVGNVAAAG